MVKVFNIYPIIIQEFNSLICFKQNFKFIINLGWSNNITLKINLFLTFIFISQLFSQAEWVDSDGETSYILIKEQYDSLQTKTEILQKDLNKLIIKMDQIQVELDYCNYSTNLNNSSNYLLEQSIPLKTENYWIWFGAGILGGFSICQLLNL